MNLLRKIELLAIFIVLTAVANAQLYSSCNISKIDGLSDGSAKAICVDHLGYVWIGTEHGLNRYDGFETAKYHRNVEDTTSIPKNDISRIYEDSAHNLWIVSSQTLCRYLRDTDSFENFVLEPSSNTVHCFYEDSTYVWMFHSPTNVCLYDKKKGDFHQPAHLS